MEKRNHSIDALRMLAMYMIVILHILGQGGVLNASSRFSGQYEAGWFLEIAAYCAVDIYALISGYIGVRSKYSFSRIIELWLQVLFYSVSIVVLFWVIAPSTVPKLEWLKAAFPVMFNQYWYFSSYVALFLFMPILNFVLEKMAQKEIRFCIGMILFFFCFMQTVFYCNAFGTNAGYSAIWLMILYLLGGYIRKYGQRENGKAIGYAIGYFAIIIFTWLSKLFIEILTLHLLGEVRAGNYLISYISPTILFAAVCLLLCFERIHVSTHGEKVVSLLSPMAFGVYLVHTHPLVYSIVLKDRFAGYASSSWIVEIMLVLGTAIAIYCICSLIDFLRLQLFKMINIRNKLELLTKVWEKL